jgi:hypothetical protein
VVRRALRKKTAAQPVQRPQCQGGYISVSQQLRSRSHLTAQCKVWQTQAPAHQSSQTATAAAYYSGQLLNDMCQATNLINLTGATCNDLPAAASFISTSTSTSTSPSPSPSSSPSNSKRKRKASRIDHMLVSPSVLQHFTQYCVMRTCLAQTTCPSS